MVISCSLNGYILEELLIYVVLNTLLTNLSLFLSYMKERVVMNVVNYCIDYERGSNLWRNNLIAIQLNLDK